MPSILSRATVDPMSGCGQDPGSTSVGHGPCGCAPCRCVACGDVIGVYEPLTAVPSSASPIHASLLTIEPAIDLARVPTYHSACWQMYHA